MRIVNFFDGAQSETTPTIGNIVASALVKYPDDATYEANEQGSPQTGNLYYNETLNLIRYYNGTEWINIVDEKTAQTIENKTIDGSSTGNNIVKTVASNVEVTPVGNLVSDNTQDALEEHQLELDIHETRLDGHDTDIIDLYTTKQDLDEKGQPNGYCDLDSSGLVPSIRLPSYVDDVLEYPDFASFPITGETGKIYVDLDTNFQFRWSGSIYVQLAASPVNSVNGQTGVVVLAVDDLNDVVAPSPSDDEVLTWDAGISRWVNQSVPRNLDALSDVDLTTTPPVINNVLKYDGTNWIPGTGGAGQGDVNFINNSDIESDLSGYALYKDAVQSRPEDGTGGTPSGGLIITRSTVNPLNKTASLLVSKNNTNCQGEGFSYDFTIDSMYKAKVLSIEIPYIIDSGSFTSGSNLQDSDLIVYIYDVTNNQLIEPSSFKFLSNNTSLSDKFNATFQTSATGTQYRLIWHVATSSTATWAIKFDEIKVTPSKYIYGTPITDWKTFTPTGSWTTNVTYFGHWRRVGDSAEIRTRVISSAVPATGVLTINLPSGMVIDTSKVSILATDLIVGYGNTLDAGLKSYDVSVTYNNSTSVIPTWTNSTVANQLASITPTAPFSFGGGDSVNIEYRVPIVGWSSSVQMSDSYEARVLSCARLKDITQSVASTTETTVTFNKTQRDTAFMSDVAGNGVRILSSGDYSVSLAISVNNLTVGERLALRIKRNGSELVTYGSTEGQGANSAFGNISLNSYEFVAGDVITATVQSNADTSYDVVYAVLSVAKNQAPTTISANEEISAKYRTTAAQTISNSSNTLVDYSIKVYDTHNAVTTGSGVWKFRALIAGRYRITSFNTFVSATYASGNYLAAIAYKNGVLEDAIQFYPVLTNFTGVYSVGGTTTIDLLAGEYVDIRLISQRTAGTTNLDANGVNNWITIEKVK